MKNMIILTSLFFNRVGNQSFLETVREYSKYYTIFIITSSSEKESYYRSFADSKDLVIGNVFFYRSPQLFHRFFRFIAKVVSKFNYSSSPHSDSSIDDSFINLKYSFWNIMSFRVSYVILFIYTLFLIWFKGVPVPSVFCAYEIGGVVPVIWLKTFFRKSKTIAKMQGTILYQFVLNGNLGDRSISLDVDAYKRLKNFDLVGMTNDGTFGNFVLDYFGVKQDNYVFLTNGMSEFIMNFKDNLLFDKIDFSHNIRLIAISRLIGWKRVHLSVEIMNVLINKYNNQSFSLNIYGFGSKDEIDYLQSLIEKYNLEKFVSVNGQVQYEQVPDILIKSDFLISLYKMTNVTNPLLEAVYLNVPIISISDENLIRVVSNDHDKNIFLFEEKESELALVDDIAFFLTNCNIQRIRNARRDLFNGSYSVVNSWDKRIATEVDLIERAIQ